MRNAWPGLLLGFLLVAVVVSCSDSQGRKYAKTSLAANLRDSQSQAKAVLRKYQGEKRPGKLALRLNDYLYEEVADGDSIVWIVNRLGTGSESSWFGITAVDVRGSFKLHSPDGIRLVTEQYDCGDIPTPGYDRYIPKYRDTLKDCEFGVCD